MSQGEKYSTTSSSEIFYLSRVVHKVVLLVNKIQRMTNLFFFFFEERNYTLFQANMFQDANANRRQKPQKDVVLYQRSSFLSASLY